MKVNFDLALTDFDGNDLTEKNETFRLKRAAIEALMVMFPEERDEGEHKYKRFDLASRVHKGGEQEVTPEEAALIKQRIGKLYGPAVVGPAYKLLNG